MSQAKLDLILQITKGKMKHKVRQSLLSTDIHRMTRDAPEDIPNVDDAFHNACQRHRDAFTKISIRDKITKFTTPERRAYKQVSLAVFNEEANVDTSVDPIIEDRVAEVLHVLKTHYFGNTMWGLNALTLLHRQMKDTKVSVNSGIRKWADRLADWQTCIAAFSGSVEAKAVRLRHSYPSMQKSVTPH